VLIRSYTLDSRDHTTIRCAIDGGSSTKLKDHLDAVISFLDDGKQDRFLHDRTTRVMCRGYPPGGATEKCAH